MIAYGMVVRVGSKWVGGGDVMGEMKYNIGRETCSP